MTHGSRELDEDAAKLAALGQDPGPTILDLIADLRGGLPEACYWCQQAFTAERYPIPEEAGEWICRECLTRVEAAEALAAAPSGVVR